MKLDLVSIGLGLSFMILDRNIQVDCRFNGMFNPYSWYRYGDFGTSMVYPKMYPNLLYYSYLYR